MPKNRKLFVNLPVRDLQRSVEFFTKLGFGFDARFTDANATCMPIGEDAYAMLLVEARFKDFTKRAISDARERTEAILAVSVDSRAEVDELHRIALASGGSAAMPPMDHGFMYNQSFYDPDGHHWELFWMDPGAIPAS